jgi:hypothetical protein
VHSDKTTATALTSTATQSDETYSSELATINGKPGSLCLRHEGNASAASSEQVIACSTAWRPQRALSEAQRPVSLSTSGRGDLSRLHLNMPASNVPVLVVDLTLVFRRAHAPQTWYNVDITLSIRLDFAAAATAVESSVAAVLTSAAAATTLLGGDLKYRLSGYSIAIIAAAAVLAAVAFCSRLKMTMGPNLSDGPLRPLPKLSTAVYLSTRLAPLVLVLLLCPGVSAQLAAPPPPSPPPPSPPPPPPSPPLPPPSPPGTYFAIASGPCTIDLRAPNCIRSPNYPAYYNNSQTCSIVPTALAIGRPLSVEEDRSAMGTWGYAFDTQWGYDFLRIPSHPSGTLMSFSGYYGPDNVILGQGAIQWSSDGMVTFSGWRVCSHSWSPPPPPRWPPSPPRSPPPPFPPPLPPFAPGAYFAVTSGPCTVDPSAPNCIRSPNFPSNYSNSQACSITPSPLAIGRPLTATSFRTQQWYDILRVPTPSGYSDWFSGRDGPSNFVLGPGLIEWIIYTGWSSRVTDSGWRVCSYPPSPPSPPSPPPPPLWPPTICSNMPSRCSALMRDCAQYSYCATRFDNACLIMPEICILEGYECIPYSHCAPPPSPPPSPPPPSPPPSPPPPSPPPPSAPPPPSPPPPSPPPPSPSPPPPSFPPFAPLIAGQSIIATNATVVRLGLTFAGALSDYSATQIAILKNALSARLNCTAPACLMTLRLSAASVLLSMDLTIPNNGPGNPSAAVAQANAAANVLAATPFATLSAQLSAATGTQVNVVGIISASVATGVLVPLVVAPPPPSPPRPPSPPPSPPLKSNPPPLAVETSGSIGIIIGVIVGVILALILALVFMRRRRRLNEKNAGMQASNGQPVGLQLQVRNGREAHQDKKGAAARKDKAENQNV